MHISKTYLATLSILSATIAHPLTVLNPSEGQTPLHNTHKNHRTCRKAKVAVLGAGTSGITAAWALSNASVTDFVIVEHNDYIGGRVVHTPFGQKADGSPYTVELGANWFHSVGNFNPVWMLGRKYGIDNTYSNYSSILTYDEKGAADFSSQSHQYHETYKAASQHSGVLVSENRQDVSARGALSLAGWMPGEDMHAKAVEWWGWDFNWATPPDYSSALYALGSLELAGEYSSYVKTYGQSKYLIGQDYFVWDQRGFNTFINSAAREFLKPNDPRLLLNTTVTSIEYADDSVKVIFKDGGCVEADHAISTFSVGVLQSEVVGFQPPLPNWKREAIHSFKMATYTKIFLQFNETFWDPDTQYFLYADPKERGRYPLFQSLSTEGFHEGSNILFVTVTNQQSYVVENQSDEETKAQVMEVLRNMFPDVHVPEPIAFMYPRWTKEEWAHGSYSVWPVGVTLERHQNLRANVGRLWFAGEATSSLYTGSLQGAWFEGQAAGRRVAKVLSGRLFGTQSDQMKRYEALHGTTYLDHYTDENGLNLDEDSFYDGK